MINADSDSSVVLKRMLSESPLPSAHYKYGDWTITHHTKPTLVKRTLEAKKITPKTN